MSGTKYTIKEELLDAIVKRCFPNKEYKVTPTGLQLNYLDIVESLWDGANTYETLTAFNDLKALVTDGNLIPGKFYAFPYQCIHRIYGTSDVNIDSAEYVEKIETFVTQALSNTELNPFVKSLQHTSDFIIWDYANQTVEGSLGIRPGKVTYRKNNDDNISTYFDNRGVYVRKGEVNTTSIPVWTSGQNWNKGDLVYTGGGVRRVTKDLTNSTAIDTYEYAIASPFNRDWVLKDSIYYINSDTVTRINTTDSLTFEGTCKNIELGYTSEYGGNYFYSCRDMKIDDNPEYNYFYSCNNVNISSKDSTYNVLNAVNSFTVHTGFTSCFVGGCYYSIVEQAQGAVFYGDDYISTKTGIYGSNFVYCKFSSFDTYSNFTSYHNVQKSNIGNYINDCSFRNISSSTIGNDHDGHDITGLERCTIGNDCSDFLMSFGTNQYNLCEETHFGSECDNITIDSSSSLDRVTLGDNISSLTITSCSISDCGFKGLDNNTSLSSSTISFCSFGFTANIDIFAINMSFVTTGSNFTLVGNLGSVQSCSFGDYVNLTSFDSSTLISCKATNLYLSADDGYFSNTDFGNSCAVYTTGGSNIYDSVFHTAVTSIYLNGGSQLNSCLFESNVSYININRTTNPLLLYNCIFGASCRNKTIESALVTNASKTEIHNGFIEKEDQLIETYYGSADINLVNTLKSKKTEAVTLNQTIPIQYSSADVFTCTISTDGVLNVDGLGYNNKMTLIITNTDTVSHTVTFAANMNVDYQATLIVGISLTKIYEIMRVNNGVVDRTVVLQSESV